MATTTFINETTVIEAEWCNEVDALVHDILSAPTSVAEVKTALSLTPGTDVQAFDATLTSIAALGTAADKFAYTTGVDTWAEGAITAAGRALLDDATAADQRTTLGLVIGTNVQAYDATILNAADIGVSVQAYNATYLVDADIGVNVQAYDATILVAADIGTTVQAYNATYLVDADIGVTVEAYAGFTAPILDKAAPGNIGATTPGTGKFSTLESVNDLTVDADASGTGSVIGAATGGAKGAGTVNAKGLYVDGVSVVNSGVRGAVVRHSTTQSLADNTITPLVFDSEYSDTDSIHDTITNTSRLTVPSGVTKVRLKGQISFNTNGTGSRAAAIFLNGTTTDVYGIQRLSAQATNDTVIQVCTPILTVVATNYFEIYGWQNSGGALDVLGGAVDLERTWFEMEIIA